MKAKEWIIFIYVGAIVVIVLVTNAAMQKREEIFIMRAMTYSALFSSESRWHPECDYGNEPAPKRLAYFRFMKNKYFTAAKHPWLPVPADPPEPR